MIVSLAEREKKVENEGKVGVHHIRDAGPYSHGFVVQERIDYLPLNVSFSRDP